MEFLTDFMMDSVSKLNENQKEEIDIIESVANLNIENADKTKEKIFRYLKRKKCQKIASILF